MAEINIAPSLKRPSPGPRRKLSLALLVFALLVGLPSWLIYREVHHQRLNRALITAIKAGNTSGALRLLQAGADGSARDTGSQPGTLGDLLSQWWDRLLHRTSASSAQQQNHHSALLLFYETLIGHDNPSKNSVQQNEELALALLDAGAPVEDQDDESRTILEWAVIYRHSDVVRRLLAGKARVNTVDTFGKTPLLKADAEDARSLLEHGADTESKNDEGETALFDPDLDKTELLLQHGAKIEAVDNSGKTPLLNAISGSNPSDRRVLILLKHGANLHARDRMGATLLLRAASWCRLETLQAMVQRGADPHERDSNGTTTLMISIDNPDERVFYWLLNQKVDVNAIGINKNTALSIARQRQEESSEGSKSQNRYVALGQLLKSRGASEISGHPMWYWEDGD